MDPEHHDWARSALREHEGPLLRYAVSLTGDLEAARDAVQDTFLRLFEQRPEALNGRLAPWLFTVRRNRVLDHIRKERRMTPLDEQQSHEQAGSDPTPAAETEQRDSSAAVLRLLAAKEFNDDAKDAGEIGAGHTVTAFYEVVPVGAADPVSAVDPLRYQATTEDTNERGRSVMIEVPREAYLRRFSKELLFVKLRYKEPDGDTSRLLEVPVIDAGRSLAQASADFKFASAVAGFGMRLRHSASVEGWSFRDVENLAEQGLGRSADASRTEFIDLVRKAAALKE